MVVQGPDHSSGYLERFLQLANDDPDHLPGLGPAHRAEMEAGFAAADTGGQRQRRAVLGSASRAIRLRWWVVESQVGASDGG